MRARRLAVLLTFSAEMRSAVRTEFQRIIAVLLPAQGDAVEVNEPERWLQLARRIDRCLPRDVWQTLFAQWVPKRQRKAASIASAVMQRIASEFTADHQEQAERGAGELEIGCAGAPMISAAHSCRRPAICSAQPRGPDWRLLSAPLDRLAAFAADGEQSTGATARGEQRHRAVPARRERERVRLSPPILSPIGMLMLVPPASPA